MNAKFNHWFEQTAADPARRRTAIADFTKQRTLLFCCASIVTVSAVVATFFTGTHKFIIPILWSLAAFMSWISAIRVDANLRVLKLIEHFHSNDEKTAR